MATSTGTPTNRDIWLIDPARADTATRLTFDPVGEGDPIWSPDGLQILFSSSRNGETYSSAFRHQADGGGEDVSVVTMDVFEAPDWSHDGRSVVFTAGAANRDLEIFFLAPDGTLMAANVTLDRDNQAEVPRVLFPTALLRGTDRHTYVVTKDGQRFLFPVPDPKQALVAPHRRPQLARDREGVTGGLRGSQTETADALQLEQGS